MKRTCSKEDMNQIQDILHQIMKRNDVRDVDRMGGLTNRTYHVIFENDDECVVRLPGEGTHELICRNDERKSTLLACELGIDTELLYFGEDGVKISKYIQQAETLCAQRCKEHPLILKMADLFRKLHHCQKDTGVSFEVFAMAEDYEMIIKDKCVRMYDDYDHMKSQVMNIKSEIDQLLMPVKVPCHNDPLCENWILSGERMYLIDWEYAGMNDAIWYLADVSLEAGFGSEEDELLLTSYLLKVPSFLDRKHFLANKVYVDYLWTLWAKARVPYDGEAMEQWADERYDRMKKNIEQYAHLNQEQQL